AVRVVRQDGIPIQLGWSDFCPEQCSLTPRPQVPEANRLVIAGGGYLFAVRTERRGCRRRRVSAEDSVELAGGCLVKVNLVMVEATDSDLPAGRDRQSVG